MRGFRQRLTQAVRCGGGRRVPLAMDGEFGEFLVVFFELDEGAIDAVHAARGGPREEGRVFVIFAVVAVGSLAVEGGAVVVVDVLLSRHG